MIEVPLLGLSPEGAQRHALSALKSTTRWSTTLSSKVNLHHAINFRAFGANLVT